MSARRTFALLLGLMLTSLLAPPRTRHRRKRSACSLSATVSRRTRPSISTGSSWPAATRSSITAASSAAAGRTSICAKAALHEKAPAEKAGLYGSGKSLKQELLAEKWDIITIQQASIRSHDVATYRPVAKELYDYIKKYAPASEVVIHQTWAYRVDDPRFTAAAQGRAAEDAEGDVRWPLGRLPHDREGTRRPPHPRRRRVLRRRTPTRSGATGRTATFDVKAAKPPALPDQTHSLHVGRRWGTTGGKARCRWTATTPAPRASTSAGWSSTSSSTARARSATPSARRRRGRRLRPLPARDGSQGD